MGNLHMKVLILPGHLMIKLAPLLYVFSKLLEIASSAGNLMGVPLPSNGFGLGNKMEEAKNMVDALQEHVQSQLEATEDTRETLGSVQKTMQSSYSALKELLSSGEAAKNWQAFI